MKQKKDVVEYWVPWKFSTIAWRVEKGKFQWKITKQNVFHVLNFLNWKNKTHAFSTTAGFQLNTHQNEFTIVSHRKRGGNARNEKEKNWIKQPRSELSTRRVNEHRHSVWWWLCLVTTQMKRLTESAKAIEQDRVEGSKIISFFSLLLLRNSYGKRRANWMRARGHTIRSHVRSM